LELLNIFSKQHNIFYTQYHIQLKTKSFNEDLDTSNSSKTGDSHFEENQSPVDISAGHSLNCIEKHKYLKILWSSSINEHSKSYNLNKRIIKGKIGASVIGKSPYIKGLYLSPKKV